MRNVMILAAGRGSRLRPLTDKMPKPLVEIQGKPLIEYHLQKLSGCTVVINHAWLGQKIEQALGYGDGFGVKIVYSPEPEGGLETAGGIIQALPNLVLGDSADKVFMVVNGDVFTDFDFTPLLEKSLEAGVLAHLILVPTPRFKPQGDFGLDAQGFVQAQGDFTFAGISLLHADLFKGEKGGFLPLAPILRRAIAEQRVTGEVYEGYWRDIGTLERLEEARQRCQKGVK